MHVSALLLLFCAYGLVHALTVPGTSPWPEKHLRPASKLAKRAVSNELAPRALCPLVWWTIATELKLSFLGIGGCNNLARQAIRAAFHDCFVDGCNGSLMLSGECERSENNGLEDICTQLPKVRAKYGVGMADLIQFAGAVAVEVCPLGPAMPFFAGREDSTTASAQGQLPSVTGSGDQLLNMFKAKGFTATDLAALIGAHTTSKQFFVDKTKVGAAQDTTPNVWDVAYYGQTLAGTAPFTFESDKNLAAQTEVKKPFKSFVGNQLGWNGAFVVA
ncbi:heme peroxidase [Lophium mytilinum]|uniref:Peroxidase n=1 Tax=Lophium mytilinum TaxID=390894 RepID=A0A6A6R7P1_9PEZI|nr:heme peroxidase [Lophium mytilinum]